jgi:putative DNA primase/helicase
MTPKELDDVLCIGLEEEIQAAKTKPSKKKNVHPSYVHEDNQDPLETSSILTAKTSPPPTNVVTLPTENERPCYRAYRSPFKVAGEYWRPGTYFHFAKEEKDDDDNLIVTLVDYWFLSWLSVLAIVRTASGNEHGYLIEYIAHGETDTRRLVLPQSALLGRADEAFKVLRSHGVTVLNKHLKTIRSYLDEQHLEFSAGKQDRFWTCTKTIGWYSRKSFLLPNEIIGEKAGICFNGNGEQALYGKAGAYKGWRDNVAALCTGNPYLVFALSSSFTGPLLKWLSIAGAGVHFFGDSSVGKTTAQYVGISSWASPAFMLPWRGTGNGLEGNAACRCDGFMALDDVQSADPKIVDTSVYMLINGMPKPRMNRDTSLKDSQVWRLFALSSGELAIETHVGSTTDHKAGQAMRLVDVSVKATHGLFDNLHNCANGKVFSELILRNCAKHYGHAAPMFVKMLIDRMPTLDLQTELDRLYQRFSDDLSAQEGRVARVFATVAMAGELATEWGIVPWTAGEAKNTALSIFRHWKEAQPRSAKSREHAQILKRVADFIDTHGDSRFSDIDWKQGIDRWGNEEKEPAIRERAGFFEDNGTGERVFLFTGSGLREAAHGFDFARVLRALEEADVFTDKGADEKAKRRRTPDGRNPKLYHIDPAKLDPKT